MVLFPHCKINIGLGITARRPDGYHNIETIFYPVPVFDILEIIPAPQFQFTTGGGAIPGLPEDNICVKAYRLMRQRFPQLPAVHLHLHKALPMGAGLGGGSSNGTFVIRLLNQKFNLGLNTAEVAKLALELGSDCPFFAYNHPCFATGRGELLNAVDLDLSGYWLVLVMPGTHVSTREAFAGITPAASAVSLQQQVQRPVHEWKHTVQNDFEATVFKQHPHLAVIKQRLYDAGAVYASMSGSGSTVYGLFPKNGFRPAALSTFDAYRVKVIEDLRLQNNQ